MKKQTLALLLSLLCSLSAAQVSFAQLPEDQTVYALIEEAIGLMDNGDPDEAIRLLEDALELDPESYLCRYEMAYAYYMKQDYAEVVKISKPLVKHPECTPLLYQMLGNAYDMNGNPRKAIKTYEKGLARFPESGALYVEKGSVLAKQQNFAEAVESYSQAIKVDPLYAPSYYWDARFLSALNQPVRAMLYAEIFMILAPEDSRNAEMSRLLFDSYKKHLIIQENRPLAAQFGDDLFYIAVMALVLDNPTTPTFPFEMLYDRGVIAAVESETQVDLASLNRIRTRFFSFCWKNMADIQKSLETYDYPDLSSFFSFIREVEQAGHLEAYNYWILREGNWDEFQAWYKENPQKLLAFSQWFDEHDLKIVDPQEFLSELPVVTDVETPAEEETEQLQSQPQSASPEEAGDPVMSLSFSK